ncbi:ABC-type thiamine transport system, substrate-binding protein [Singulisphaera sp. GP187]|uniref:hypothetical protein n=1 Tax=Singulisphaera sp. GP187 TaxID=1882752 RepID=UPI00092C2D21|nr:hypothetical protein [Singulisphaera sp. GP187]SIO19970.1 ABC-type thiamine transport system, substrate-binding protein [Singulisphaera sp. GP187]
MSRRAVRLLSFGGVLLGASLGLFGCVRIPGQSGSLTIATSWSQAERSQLDEAFERWLVTKTDPEPFGTGIKIDWLTIERGLDLSRVVQPRRGRWDPRPPAPDIVLGGPPSSYRRLAKLGKLAPIDGPEPRLWNNVHRSPMGWAVRPSGVDSSPKTATNPPIAAQPPASSRPPQLTFDDPRHDPVALAWAKGELSSGTWAEGYARLVQSAGNSRRIGRQSGSALAAVERGEAEATPAVALDVAVRSGSVRFLPAPEAPDWIEGAGIVAGPGPRQLPQLFIQFLNETGRAEKPQAEDPAADFEVDSLLADLLGATLVDAQEELWTAWATLNRAKSPARAAMWLTQAPPWPPASIEKLEGDNAEVLVQTLIEQLAPDAELRAWLSRSWLGPKRLVDGALLEEIAHAADGRLAREPRFRAWLRAEWTAWSRQRYRRVTRTATGLKP